MAPPAKAQAVNPPATLPADFFEKQQNGPPDTLPGNFNFGDTPPPPASSSMGSKLLGMGKDLGKGLLESAGGTAYTLGAPVAGIAHKMGLLSQETPEQHQQQESLFKPANATQAIGAGAGDAAQAFIPVEKALPVAGKVGGLIGDAVRPITSKLSEFNQAFNPLPLRSRAVNALTKIEGEAKDIPLSLKNTQPAIDQFQKYVSTGGIPSRTMRKLVPRAEEAGVEGGESLNFPEARDFYTNLTRETKQPGFLKRAIESPGKPQQRFELGGAKEGLNKDLTDAAEQIKPGRGQDLQNAMKEYGQNASLRRFGKRLLIGGGAYAGEEALRNMGLLGGLIRRIPGGQ